MKWGVLLLALAGAGGDRYINLGSAGDHVVVNGDLSGTGIATSTLTIHGGTFVNVVPRRLAYNATSSAEPTPCAAMPSD